MAAKRVIKSHANRALHSQLVHRFFSRDPKQWPVFGLPDVARTVEHLRRTENEKYPTPAAHESAEDLQRHMARFSDLNIPQHMAEDGRQATDFTAFVSRYTKNWMSPRSVENVASACSDPAITGHVFGAVANANLVQFEFSNLAADLEDSIVRRVANLTGYAPDQAAGIFTAGGTFCNMYGMLLGLRRAFPDSVRRGVPQQEDYRFICSHAGHYSNATVLSTMGINVQKRIVSVPITLHNDMDMAALREALESCFRLGVTVPAILLTMGTTDTFAVDDIKRVHQMREELCAIYGVNVKPHIHVDSAVGWAAIFLNDYDLTGNPLGFTDAALECAEAMQHKFRYMHLADSFTVDFHKWGYAPYPSSLIMIKDKSNLGYLAQDPSHFSYFQSPNHGHELFRVTMECSRSALGVFSASMMLDTLGKEGMQLCIGNGLQNASYLRHLLRGGTPVSDCGALSSPTSRCASQHLRNVRWQSRAHVQPSIGPSVTFRLYPEGVDAAEQFAWEVEEGGRLLDAHEMAMERAAAGKLDAVATSSLLPAAQSFHGLVRRSPLSRAGTLARQALAATPVVKSVTAEWEDYHREVAESCAFHRACFDRRQHQGLFSSWIGKAFHTVFSPLRGHSVPIQGEKLVFFNPLTSYRHVHEYVTALADAVVAEDGARREAEAQVEAQQ